MQTSTLSGSKTLASPPKEALHLGAVTPHLSRLRRLATSSRHCLCRFATWDISRKWVMQYVASCVWHLSPSMASSRFIRGVAVPVSTGSFLRPGKIPWCGWRYHIVRIHSSVDALSFQPQSQPPTVSLSSPGSVWELFLISPVETLVSILPPVGWSYCP